MTQQLSFVSALRGGQTCAHEINAWIAAWHDLDTDIPELHDFLGFTPDQYKIWASDPKALPGILAQHGIVNPDIQGRSLIISHNISSKEQEGSFMNSTITTLDEGAVISIALSPPHSLSVRDAAQVNSRIREALASALAAGWTAEIQIGRDDEVEEIPPHIASLISNMRKGEITSEEITCGS